MGIGYIVNDEDELAMVCTTSDTAFGPVIRGVPDEADHLYMDVHEYVDGFLEWVMSDPRSLDHEGKLEGKIFAFNEHCKDTVICQGCRKHVHKHEVICDECKEDFEEDARFESDEKGEKNDAG